MNKTKRIILLLKHVLVIAIVFAFAESAAASTWVERLVTSGLDVVEDVVNTSDGNIVAAGQINGTNILIAKFDPDGRLIWLNAHDGGGTEYLNSLEETADGGFIASGYTDGGSSGTTDFFVTKLDSAGAVEFFKIFDNNTGASSNTDVAMKVRQTIDGGYLAVGYTNNITSYEGWVIKIDANGNVLWDKTFGGADEDLLMDFVENADGSFILAGYTLSFPTAPVVPGSGEYRGWLTKIDSSGNLLWSQAYEADDPLLGPATKMSLYFWDIEQSSKVGYYLIAGKAQTRNIGSYTGGLLFQVDGTGLIDKSYGYEIGAATDVNFHDMISGGSYAVSAEGNFDGATVAAALITIDSPINLNLSLVKSYDNGNAERGYAVSPAPDGGFVIGGAAMGIIAFPGLKHRDFWVAKVDSSGDLDDPNCANLADYTSAVTKTALTALATSTPAFTVSENSGVADAFQLINSYRPLLEPSSYCAACLTVSGTDPMTAGGTNELTVDAYDTYGNLAVLYNGSKNFIFSGLASAGAYIPEVEGVDFGTAGAFNFTGGTSDAGVATLTAYAAETSTVHVSDGYATSEAWGYCGDGGLPLTVDVAALDHYNVSATTPQQTGRGWQETVRAEDLYGNLRTTDAQAFDVTNTGSAAFYTDNTYTAATSAYNLVGGLADIFLKDLTAETIAITATDAGAKTGTSGPIVIANPPPVAGGRGGGGGGSYNPPVTQTDEEDAENDLHEAADETGAEAVKSSASPQTGESYLNLACLKKEAPEYSFADSSGHFAESAIRLLAETLSSEAYVTQGYLDGQIRNFRPNQPVTRAEFLKMSMLANCVLPFGDESGAPATGKVFGDLPPEGEAWYVNYVYSALAAGIVDGAEDGNFYPDRPITRAEATKILVNIQHLADDSYAGTDYFEDVSETDWFFRYVSAGKESELIYGAKDNAGNDIFKPNDLISRGETALILVRIFNLRDYVTFTDPNARDYEYTADRAKPTDDLQASVLGLTGADAVLPAFLLIGSAGLALVVIGAKARTKGGRK